MRNKRVFGYLPLSDPRWAYDDPSGLPDDIPVTVHVPEPLLLSIEAEAQRTGTTPAAWLLNLVHSGLNPPQAAA